MWCQDVWTGDALAILRLAQGIPEVPIARVERWHSEFEDADSPWMEWRLVDEQGHCRVRWRIREEPGPSALTME